MQASYDGLAALRDDMQALSDSVPRSFEAAKEDYLQIVEADAEEIKGLFHAELNRGFKDMFLLVAACAAVGLVVLALYRDERTAAKGRI